MKYDRNAAAEILAATPNALRAMLSDLRPEWTHSNYGRRTYDDGEKETWSPIQILAHLIHGEKTDWIPRARHILEHGQSKPFEPFDREGHIPHMHGRTIAQLLDEFQSLRSNNIQALKSLPLDENTRKQRGRHPALGPVTLEQLLATWVVHDLNHIHQIALSMAKQYQKEVGPWQAYLSILK